MNEPLGQLESLKFSRSKNGRIVLSFQIVDLKGENRSQEAAILMLPADKYIGLPEEFQFRLEETHGITPELDILMRATSFPSIDTPLRIEVIYSPENSRKALPTEKEALMKIPVLLTTHGIVSHDDATQLRDALSRELDKALPGGQQKR